MISRSKLKRSNNVKTTEDHILDWFRENRGHRVTGYLMICKGCCLLKDFTGSFRRLVADGRLRKLKTGYKLPKQKAPADPVTDEGDDLSFLD